jgi:phage gp36-like protein
MQFAEKAVNEATDSIDRYLATKYAELLQLTSDISSPLLKAVE